MKRRYNLKIKTRVRFDQNLTVSCSSLFESLIREFYRNKEVVEIGPGKGYFSSILKEVSFSLLLLEIDSEFCKNLSEEKYNVLEVDFKKWIESYLNSDNKDKKVFLFSSLPYSQLKALFCSLLDFEGYFIAPYYLLEKKGVFSNYIRYCFEARKIGEIPSSYFEPIPSISSSYFYIKRKRRIEYSRFKNKFNRSLKIIGDITSMTELKRKRLHELTEEEITRILEEKQE